MKKFFKIIAGFFAALFVLIVAVYFFRNRIIIGAVKTFVPKMTGTPVSIGKVDFRPFSGFVSIHDLKIGNPKGFSDGNVFSLGTISVSLQTGTLLKDKIIIKDILIDNVSVTYEWANGTSNIAQIQKNTSSETTAVKEQPKKVESTQKSSKTVVIKNFVLKDAEVSADISGIKMTLPLPSIKLKDIGENKPSTPEEIFTTILEIFSKETLHAVTKATGEIVKSGAKGIGKFIENIF